LYAPNFAGLAVLVLMIISPYVLFGVIAAIVASSAGAESSGLLSRKQHFWASAWGSLLGCLCFCAFVALGSAMAKDVVDLIALVLLGSLPGGVVGFKSAKCFGSRLRRCGASRNWPAHPVQ
jgi:hypothetical protein